MTGDNPGISGTSSCGMMGSSWGQATAGGTGRYGGWAALGLILVIILIIIWIIVGILLIFNLYRKLSSK
jgi:tellurite resistance protein TehA-like permease